MLEQKHIVMGIAVLGPFAAALIMLMYLVLPRPAVYTSKAVKLFDENGAETYTFKTGQWAYVRREVCVSKEMYARLSPTLFDMARKATIPLIGYAVVSRPEDTPDGCGVKSAGFQVPNNLPSGQYEYRNVIGYQNNPVGRDEMNPYPPVRLTVIRDDR